MGLVSERESVKTRDRERRKEFDAPLEHSDGHLIVVLGLDEAHAFVNDPAQPAVATRYPRAALDLVFRDHGGVAYLVAPRERSAELVALANGAERLARR